MFFSSELLSKKTPLGAAWCGCWPSLGLQSGPALPELPGLPATPRLWLLAACRLAAHRKTLKRASILGVNVAKTWYACQLLAAGPAGQQPEQMVLQ